MVLVHVAVLAVLILAYLFYRRRTPVIEVSEMYYYPVKSCKPIKITQSAMNIGLAYDREWGIFDSNNRMINFKKEIEMVRIQPRLEFKENGEEDKLTLEYPGHSPFVLDLANCKDGHEVEIEGGGKAQDQGDEVAEWLNTVFKKDLRFMRLREPRQLNVIEKYEVPDDLKVSFSGSGELLITSENSFKKLESSLRHEKKLDHLAFRPNLIVKGAPSFDENDWWIFKIGDVTFEGVLKCSRCIFTTLDFDTGEYDPNSEPLATLRKINYEKHHALFGLYARKKTKGVIKVGDRLTVLSRKKLGCS